jgi:N-glycosylase/DNA lyase
VGKAGAVTPWSEWRPVAGLPAPMRAEVLGELLDGGQAFRWNACADGSWLGVWSGNVARVRPGQDGRLEWCAPVPMAAETGESLEKYLATGTDFAALTDALPWRSDPHLAGALAAFPGLRILRQPLGETLLGFMCSAMKQIVQIKRMLELLAEKHGAPVAVVELPEASASVRLHRLPTWPELARIPERDLRACLLGFRARHIAATARFLAERPGWIEETEALPHAAAQERLRGLPGVGEKIADCALLFGAGRLEAFPVDVWILRALAGRYGLEGWKPEQVARFGRAHFGASAGLAQQFLFARERRAARVER